MADQEALTAAREEGRTAERTRISAILTSDAAKGRIETALVFALETDMAAEAAVKALAATPLAPAASSRLDREAPRLKLAADGGAETPASQTERGRQAFAAALGKKLG